MKGLSIPNRPVWMDGEWYKYQNDLLASVGLSSGYNSLWSQVNVTSFSCRADATTPPSIGALRASEEYYFIASATSTLHGAIIIPPDFLTGSELIPFIKWTPDNTNTGDCYWRLSYCFTEDGTQLPGASTINIQVAGGGTSLAPQTDTFTQIDGPHSGAGNFAKGNIFRFVISRIGGDAADTFTGSSYFDCFGLYYKREATGSKDRTLL